MEQEFIPVYQIMESGINLVSPHLRWLLRHAIVEHCGDKAINLISYCTDIPKDQEGNPIWGETFSPCRSIAINLEAHFYSCINQIQDENKMYTALRTVLIRELLDTAIHEAHHLKASLTADDFSNSTLEEDEAKTIAWEKSWMAAKHWDTEITVFGPILDALLVEFMSCIKEDTKEKPEMWKDLQVYMWENGLAFYNPDKEQECKMREAFETMATDENPWIDDPKMFLAKIGTPSETLAESETAEAFGNTPVQKQEYVATDNYDESFNTEIVDKIPENLKQVKAEELKQPEFTYEQMIGAGWTNETLLENPTYSHLVPVIPTPQSIPAPPAPPTPATPPAPPAPPIQTLDTINVQQIQKTVENVMRVLFIHVMTKCGITNGGTFNNPTAVLEPINIANIPHAEGLFTHMDTADTNGVYAGNQPCNGFIKGLVSKQDLPMYRFYLNIGGNLYRRTFIPQNPNKLNANLELTKWAQEAQNGAKIMMLLEDNKGPRAHIKLAAGAVFGQEEFKIWSDK